MLRSSLRACSDSTDGELPAALLSEGGSLGVVLEHNIDPDIIVQGQLTVGKTAPGCACKDCVCENFHVILISSY